MENNSNLEAKEDQSEIDLIDILTAVGEEKFWIAGIAFVITLVGLAVSLLTTPIYTARTSLLPPQQSVGASSAISASLGALAGLGGLSKTPEEMYVKFIKSESVERAIDDRFKLQSRYELKNSDDLRKKLDANVRATVDRKSTLINLDVDDEDPQFAAELANAYVEELRTLLSRIAVTEAQQRRVFFERQMGEAKDALVKAEFSVKKSQDSGGLVSVDAQTQALISAAAQLRGQIVVKEVQLQALRQSSGPENPEMLRVMAELQSLRNQLSKLEGGTEARPGSAKDAAEGLQNVRLFRELKYQEAVYTAMLQQFQLAKVDEAKDAPLIQQIDVAKPPHRKSKPSRALIVIGFAMAGLFLGLLVAFGRRFIRSAKADSASAVQFSRLKQAWGMRGG
jgi:tyrosine-protein kinase Etk/Wzc